MFGISVSSLDCRQNLKSSLLVFVICAIDQLPRTISLQDDRNRLIFSAIFMLMSYEVTCPFAFSRTEVNRLMGR